MQLPTDTIEYEGEQFQIGYNEWFTCGDCGHSWEHTTANDPNEDYRATPPESPSCPACDASSGHEYSKRASFYTKFDTVPIEDPPLDAHLHAEAIRLFAMKFEALEANGWEMKESDGVHISFEKTEVQSTDNEYKVSDNLD